MKFFIEKKKKLKRIVFLTLLIAYFQTYITLGGNAILKAMKVRGNPLTFIAFRILYYTYIDVIKNWVVMSQGL